MDYAAIIIKSGFFLKLAISVGWGVFRLPETHHYLILFDLGNFDTRIILIIVSI